MDALEFFRNTCFPGGPDSSSDPQQVNTIQKVFQKIFSGITKKSRTEPRETAFNSRHPSNQGGLIVDESGNTEIRSGHILYDHAIGSALSLLSSGHIVLSAPAGLVFTGESIYLSGKPSEMFHFVGGQFQFNDSWEEDRLIFSPKTQMINNGTIDNLFFLYIDGSGDPIPVPVKSFFEYVPLYTEVDNDE